MATKKYDQSRIVVLTPGPSNPNDLLMKGAVSKSTQSWVRRLLLVIPFLLCVIVFCPNQHGSIWQDISPVNSADQTRAVELTPEAKTSDNQKSDNQKVVERWIPDQKAMLGGAKVTTLDLEPLLKKSELGKSGRPIKVEVLRAKNDVAEVSVEGMVLTLKWKTKTGKKRDVLIRASVSADEYIDTKFYVQLWEPEYWKLILTVLGGLGIFLLGMKNMSEGLQAIAGNGLRKMISWVTDNRLMATGVGTLITMLVQSSSITTVTVVGFVNSGFMTLRQAIGVIMGANIGTTITGWILVLKIGKYGLPIAGVAAFFYLFSKRDRMRYLAMTVMGLGLIFFGLELMKDGFSVVKELPQFEQWFRAFTADTYVGVLKCAAVGCILTFIVQSSSATLGITIGLAQLGVIEFETAAALVLGENIGTTITAWLASFGATTNAKRAAYFHCIFNLLGVLWITAVFQVYLMGVRYFVTGDSSGEITLESSSAATITAAIAATHTGFNLANTLIFLPFTRYFTVFLESMIPEKSEDKETPKLTNLDVRMLESPAIAIEQSRNEVIEMAENCRRMMDLMRQIEKSSVGQDDFADEILRMEEHQDAMQIEFVLFMSNLLAANVPHNIVDESRQQLRLVDEYESISDCIASVVKSKRHIYKRELIMPESESIEIVEFNQVISDFLEFVNKAYVENKLDSLDDASVVGESITKQAKALSKKMMKRSPEDQLSPFLSTSYSRQVASYRRIRDHLINIVEVLRGEK